MQNVTNFLSSRLKLILAHPITRLALHTAWQAPLAFLLAQKSVPQSSGEVQALFVGLYGASLSGVKTGFLQIVVPQILAKLESSRS